MGRKHRRRFRSIAYALFSACLLACLVVAPLCSARCATTLCLPASSDNAADTCHHSSHHTGPALAFTAAPSGACAVGELIFTTPRPSNLSVSVDSYVSAVLSDLNTATPSVATGLAPCSARVSIFFSPPLPLRI